MSIPLIYPDWPAPDNVKALITTRQGGVSLPPWDTFNLGAHVHDDPVAVGENRRRLLQIIGAPDIAWLNQVHGVEVVELPYDEAPITADAATTRQEGIVCAVLTADCLPVLLCNQQGTQVAAAHAGWRGLAAGVLESAVASFEAEDQVMAYLGPAIGPRHFEVGPEVRAAFVAGDLGADACFLPSPSREGCYLADIYGLARRRLGRLGVVRVFGGSDCTVTDADRFFSYRRDGETGRMASLIWLASR
ncbi:peptidoglycan editing factor PgeF [Mangrovitalea sediminis]|uniref:peptidoglycan editing factor PgeF n=1 Tax=Mangrovitalea sediminis TaxID=1982043 RepID=UPI000BE62773|nr:peptidoglycan editing factor PgeF [Mangrovitalea sediminis]